MESELTRPHPTDHGKAGTTYHLLVTADGQPLAVTITGASSQDSMLVESILYESSTIKGAVCGWPRRQLSEMHAGEAYGDRRARRYVRRRGITAWFARIGVDSSQVLGQHRWVEERTISGLLTFRRLAIRYHHCATTITGVALLAITIICARRLLRKDY